MLVQRNPHEAYRRVDFDARVAGAAPQELVLLCLEEFVIALGSAVVAHERADNVFKSKSLTRALSAITALQLGVDASSTIAGALAQLYEAARRTVLDNVLKFDAGAVGAIRQDFIEISRAMTAQARAA